MFLCATSASLRTSFLSSYFLRNLNRTAKPVRLLALYRRYRLMNNGPLKTESYGQLNNSRVVACRDDASEVSRITSDLPRNSIDRSNRHRRHVADRRVEVNSIRKIKCFSANLNRLRLANAKAFSDSDVDVELCRATQYVSTDIPEICSGCASCGSAVRARDHAALYDDRPHKRTRIEKVTVRDVRHGCL